MQFQQAQCAMAPESLFCQALTSSQVNLYKELEGKVCAQAAISGDYEKYVEEFAGFSQGTCADQGFKHADGTKTMAVPIIGNITVALYDNVLEAADEEVTLFALGGGQCGQSTLPKKYESYAEKFDSDLTEGDCASHGYTVAAGAKDIKVPFIGTIHTSEWTKPVAADEQVTLFAIGGGQCGESTLPKKYESYAEKFDSDLKEGTCASQGYTVPEGSKDITVPFIGTIHTAQFEKPAVAADEQVTLYELAKGLCGQTSISKKYEYYAEKFASLAEGTCAAQGYTVDDGAKDLKVPFIGDIKIALYSKTAAQRSADNIVDLW